MRPGPQNDQAIVSASRILLMTAVETKGCFGYNDIVSTVRVGGVRFRIHPQDHEPIHAHGRYAETAVIVVLRADRTIEKADRQDAIIPPSAKHSDVRKILNAARDHYDEIAAAWEQMQGEN